MSIRKQTKAKLLETFSTLLHVELNVREKRRIDNPKTRKTLDTTQKTKRMSKTDPQKQKQKTKQNKTKEKQTQKQNKTKLKKHTYVNRGVLKE